MRLSTRRKHAANHTTHGHAARRIEGSISSEYQTWARMFQRCTNPRNPAFKDYGGRGITICERWDAFELFLSDMGPKPPGRSLDRIDNNGPYSPENCRWATTQEQARNRRSTKPITWMGETLTITEWAKRLNMNFDMLYTRLVKRGWPVEKAMRRPLGRWLSTSE